jgi:hypothetical protein
MYATIFRQIKLRSCSKISWYVLVLLIHEVDVSLPLEVQVDVSAHLVLNNCCFSTSRTASACCSTSRTKSGCYNTSDFKPRVSVPLELKVVVPIPLILNRMFLCL